MSDDVSWEVLDVGGDDETKQALPGAGTLVSLYEVQKLAYIQRSVAMKVDHAFELKNLPSVVTCAAYGQMCVSLDNNLLIFAENCSSLKFQLVLPHTIDVVQFICCPDLLLAADREGGFHCMHVPSQRLLLSKQLPVPVSCNSPVFVDCCCQPLVDGVTSVMLTTSTGSIFRICSISVERVLEALSARRLSDLLEVQADIEVQILKMFSSPTEVAACSAALGTRLEHTWIWLSCVDGRLMHCFPSRNCLHEPFADSKGPVEIGASSEFAHLFLELGASRYFKKILPVCNARYLVTLQDNGVLGLICSVTGFSITYKCLVSSEGDQGMPLSCEDEDANHFYVVMDVVTLPWTESFAALDSVQLLVLVNGTSQRDRNKSDGWYIRILSIPNMQCEYEVEVSKGSSLVPLGEGIEAMIFLEPDAEASLPTIKIKTITDGVPEIRLRKLISKLKFKEAEEFALHFGLSVELVHKGRARHLLRQLSPFTSAISCSTSTRVDATNSTADLADDSLLMEFLLVLECISDLKFVVSLCVEATLPDIHTTQRVLQFARKLLSTNSDTLDGAAMAELSRRVSQELYKLKTFQLLYQADSCTIDQWISFASSDLLELFTEHVGKGELSIASTIWQRHQHEFHSCVDVTCIERLLRVLPVSLPTKLLLAWVRHNFSDYIRLCPPAVSSIAQWTLQRIQMLEVLEKKDWPDNAIRLSQQVIEVLKDVTNELNSGDFDLQLSLQQAEWHSHTSPSSTLCRFHLTFRALQELRTLLHAYRINISLDEYTQVDKQRVVACLLNWLVCGEEVAPLVNDFIVPVLLRCHSELSSDYADKLLEGYVMETLSSDTSTWWSCREAAWEDKLYAVIAVIKDDQVRVRCTVACVKQAGVPWSQDTNRFYQQALHLIEARGNDEDKREQLLEQKRLVTLKLILRKYALHINDFNSVTVLRRMAQSEQEDALADMMQVVSTYHHLRASYAYMLRIVYLLTGGFFDEASVVVLNIPDEQRLETLRRLVNYCHQKLRCVPRNDSMRQERLHLLSGMISLYQKLLLTFSADKYLVSVLQHDLPIFETINNLQRKFAIYLCLKELRDNARCHELLRNHVAEWYKHQHTRLLDQLAEQSKPSELEAITSSTNKDISASDAALNSRRNSIFTKSLKPLAVIKESKENFPASYVLHSGLSVANRRLSYKPKDQIPDSPSKEEMEEDSVVLCKDWCLGHVFKLARLLGITRVTVLHVIAGLALDKEHLSIAAAIIRRVCQEPVDLKLGNDKDLSVVVEEALHLLIKLLQRFASLHGSESSSFTMDTLMEEPGTEGKADLLRHCLPMISSAMHSSCIARLPWLVDVALWCNTAASLYQQSQECIYDRHSSGRTEGVCEDISKDPYTEWSFTAQYCDKGMPLDRTLVSAAILEVLLFCVGHAHRNKNVTAVKEDDACLRVISTVQELIDHAKHRNNNMAAFVLQVQLITLLQISPHAPNTKSSEVSKRLPQLSLQHMATLLFKTITPKKCDTKLAVSLFTHLTVKETFHVITELNKRLGFDYSRQEALAEVGVNLCVAYNRIEFKAEFVELAKNAKWGRKLGERNFSFKEFYGKSSTVLQELIHELVLLPSCSCSLLKDFCSDFNLSLSDALLVYLQSLLKSYEPRLHDSELDQVVKLPSTLLDRLMNVYSKIADVSLLKNVLLVQLDSTMPYNYEILEFIIQRLCEIDKNEEDARKTWLRGLDILQFLKSYVRTAKPTIFEVEEWLQDNPSSSSLPLISQRRLPFTCLFKSGQTMKKITENELNVRSIDVWLQCCESLRLNPDKLCHLAVKNSLSQHLDKNVHTGGAAWRLTREYRALFNDIKSTILKMQHDRLAMACTVNVMQCLPPGVDKLEAAATCLMMAERWQRNSDNSEAREATARFRTQYQQLAVENALHKYGLAEPEFMKLMTRPEELVTALYSHHSLASLDSLIADDIPRVNECVAEICSTLNLNLATIQRRLLDRWLSPDDFGTGGMLSDADVTVTNFQLNLLSPPSVESSSLATSAEQSSLLRLIYLLRDCSPGEVIPYLLGRAISTATQSNAVRLRALKCLLAVTEPRELQNYIDMQTVKSLIRTLPFVCRLESFGCPTDPEHLELVDKSVVAEGVWRSHRHNPQALLLIADLCLEYQVQKPSLWNVVLQQLSVMLSNRNVDETPVKSLLLRLRQQPHCWTVPGFAAVWSSIIMLPFDNAMPPLTEGDFNRAVAAVGLLAQCPVTLSEQMQRLVETCLALHQPALAIVAAASFTERHSELQSLFEKHKSDTLIKELSSIKEKIPLPRPVESLLEAEGVTLA